MKRGIVGEKSYAFAIQIVALAQLLRQNREYEIANQVMRSGTSIGSNVEEALAGISRADFVCKMSIASKEARETHYWLRLLRDSKIATPERVDPLLSNCLELIRILTAIVKTGQEQLRARN